MPQLLRFLRLLLCCFALVASAQAQVQTQPQTFGDGLALFDKGQYAEALAVWLALAEQGHASAQFNVATMYQEGLGAAPDPAQAARWYLKAAEKGDIQAQLALGLMHADGAGVPSNPPEARRWLDRAARNPAGGADAADARKRATARLGRLPPPEVIEVSYDGGRFLFTEARGGNCVIALQGRITRDTSMKFERVAAQGRALGCKSPWVLLESAGGRLEDGLRLGKEMRIEGYRTVVRGSCASSCGLIFMGGVERVLVGSRARIGFHQASVERDDDRTCVTDRWNTAYREIRNFLRFVSGEKVDTLMDMVIGTSCKSMTWVWGSEAMELSVASKLEPNR